jgi:hypothetical protein
MSGWEDDEKGVNVAAQTASESEETIGHGDVKYTATEGMNSTSVTYQDAAGAPVETSSPLGYSVSFLATMSRRNLPRFAKITEFLAHANNEHKYNIKIKLCHLPIMPQFSPSDGPSRDTSTEPEALQGTETPASSLDFDMANIGPRLMEHGPITVTETSTCPPSTEISASSARYPVTSTDSNLAEISTQRVTRGAAKAANLGSPSLRRARLENAGSQKSSLVGSRRGKGDQAK